MSTSARPRPSLRVIASPADAVLSEIARRDDLRRQLGQAEQDAKAAAAVYSAGRGYRVHLTPEQAKAEIERGGGR